MLYWALFFLAIALVSAVFGFTTIAGAAFMAAKILFFIFIILFVVFIFFGFK
ncbi:MAG: DUF1328 domain-containing protein [Candidatus Firestonebacteria bacterium RIFOXYC2_FULL_39_67]|nr:MAG: DUF1328 domain-containing protein [Candidatus Firestonebacteria bacterium RIFOXYD2_FULL_39_29]OGF55707.1 MAG: DUF1328 domain-containing protein [Candidatus Firestonebacteria bacterium RIFOXYC2_FULL_39_67]OGF57976.1 MAG: DUF1328 domain-containing protein [Candidatus Firestonebacteria bacterium RifOxyC12_full_39_7]